MTLTAIIIVLISVSMHAAWNFLSKKTMPCAAFFFLASIAASCCWIWALPYCGLPQEAFSGKLILLMLLSISAETVYFTGLFNAYSRTDISLAYPVARSLPVLLIAIAYAALYQRYPSAWGTVALLAVSFGCLIMPLKRFRDFGWKNYSGGAMFYILLAAVGTTGYTLTDSEWINSLKLLYGANGKIYASYVLSYIINTGLAVTMGIITFASKKERENLRVLISAPANLIPALLAGVLSSLAYVLILLAMTQTTQLSYLQAFRQMSLPLGMVLGCVFLREKIYIPKIIAIILILSGLLLIAFSGN